MPPASALRIFHLFRAPVGGLFRHVTDLATEQVRQGHQVGIICDAATGGAFEAQILRELEARMPLGLVRIPMRRHASVQDLASTRSVLARLGALAPDVIHGHGAKGGAYGRLIGTWLRRRRAVARIYTPHGGSMHYDPASLAGRFYFTAERLLERLTDAIIHVSRYEADIYCRKVHPPRCLVRVIPNGLRPEEFEPVVQRPDARDLLFLGAFRDLKGIDVLLDAIAALRASGRTITANLVGQPEGRAVYVDRAAALGISGQVAFHDPMRARDAFATARAVVVPSRAESMPYVVLEAIAAGMPVIATDVGGIPEIFGSRAGELVPAGDAHALARKIDLLLADIGRARTDALARRADAQSRFAVATMEAHTTALYREALQAR
ncbi:MAG TPA: glycosyltransferase family 4 protein [Xanthobacteraceae bacterium]|nr:glycosyltransferase family 4 protein [Xanthobacteraceae bacterium]